MVTLDLLAVALDAASATTPVVPLVDLLPRPRPLIAAEKAFPLGALSVLIKAVTFASHAGSSSKIAATVRAIHLPVGPINKGGTTNTALAGSLSTGSIWPGDHSLHKTKASAFVMTLARAKAVG